MTRYCPNCFVGIEPEDTRCSNCGQSLVPEEEKTEADWKEAAVLGDSGDTMSESTPKTVSKETSTDGIPLEETLPAPVFSEFEKAEEESQDENTVAGTGFEREETITGKPKAAATEKSEVMGLGEWLVTLILTCIPVVNLVMLIIWSVGEEVDPNKRNFARAGLIVMGILIALSIIATIFFILFFIIAGVGYYYY